MKKIRFLLLLPLILLSACNKQVFDVAFKFEKVHVFETNQCYEITSWTDFDDGDQIQVNIKDYGQCLFHSNQVVLIQKKCPFCGK